MSDSGMPVEEIARLAGHASSRTTELVYRQQLGLRAPFVPSRISKGSKMRRSAPQPDLLRLGRKGAAHQSGPCSDPAGRRPAHAG
jgi:hypothetical protein